MNESSTGAFCAPGFESPHLDTKPQRHHKGAFGVWCRWWDSPLKPPFACTSCSAIRLHSLPGRAKRSTGAFCAPGFESPHLYTKPQKHHKGAFGVWCRWWDSPLKPPFACTSCSAIRLLSLPGRAKRSTGAFCVPGFESPHLHTKPQRHHRCAFGVWCRWWDSNPHDVAINGF